MQWEREESYDQMITIYVIMDAKNEREKKKA